MRLITGTMCPVGRRLVNGTGSIFQRARMVCHCLLVETADALVLVDTGMGVEDLRNPYRRLGVPFTAAFRPSRDGSRAACEQVRRLGGLRDLLHQLDQVPTLAGVARLETTAVPAVLIAGVAGARPLFSLNA